MLLAFKISSDSRKLHDRVRFVDFILLINVICGQGILSFQSSPPLYSLTSMQLQFVSKVIKN